MPALAFMAEAFLFLLVVGVSFAILTLVSSFMRFYFLTQKIERADSAGLDPQELFNLRVVQQLGGLHQKLSPFTLICAEIGSVGVGKLEGNNPDEQAVFAAVEQCLKDQLRSNDTVLRRSDVQWGVVGQFGPDISGPVIDRLIASTNRLNVRCSSGAMVRPSLRLGVVSYPAHGTGTQALIQAAEAALAKAHEQGQPYCWGGDGRPPATASTDADAKSADTAPKDSGRLHPMIDEVTGALKAERLGTALKKMVAQQRKVGAPVSVAYCSIDHFQQYINHYQQSAGNAVCKGIADVLAEDTRDSDILGRIGESDFVLVLDCAPADALQVAKRLATRIKREPIRLGSLTLKVTVSIGVAGHPDHTGHAEQMMEFAQTAMWNARARGANLSLAYEAGMLKHETATDRAPKDVF